jgi:hypothetical protein
MILSDAGIKAAIGAGEIEIDPYPVEYAPSAVDLLLGEEFQSWDSERRRFRSGLSLRTCRPSLVKSSFEGLLEEDIGCGICRTL